MFFAKAERDHCWLANAASQNGHQEPNELRQQHGTTRKYMRVPALFSSSQAVDDDRLDDGDDLQASFLALASSDAVATLVVAMHLLLVAMQLLLGWGERAFNKMLSFSLTLKSRAVHSEEQLPCEGWSRSRVRAVGGESLRRSRLVISFVFGLPRFCNPRAVCYNTVSHSSSQYEHVSQ